MRLLLICLIVFTAGPALARGSAETSVRELLDNPKRYIGEIFVVRRIRCIDPGTAGFICEAAEGGRRLRLDGSVLGPITEPTIAEKLIGSCKGMAALARPTCTFDAVMTPTSPEFEDGITIVRGQEIDLLKPKR
jgi:hypothetical protein